MREERLFLKPLSQRVVNENTEILTWLIEHGAHIHQTDNKGQIPLHYACAYKLKPVVVKWLLKQGASPNQPDNEGLIPLDVARMHGHSGLLWLIKFQE